MSFGGTSSSVGITLKSFVTEDEVEEKKKQRQEQWERVRKPEDPIEFPEEELDNRCLFDKLQEQKDKKQADIDEKHKFSNQVKGLDEDEAEFLDFVSERQMEIQKAKEQEETSILKEMKKASVTVIPEKSQSEQRPVRLQSSGTQNSKKSQQALLAGAVKRKGSGAGDADSPKKFKSTADSDAVLPELPESSTSVEKTDNQEASRDTAAPDNKLENNAARIIGVLPGLCNYDNTSDSESSSSVDSEPEFTLCRSPIVSLKQIKAHIQKEMR